MSFNCTKKLKIFNCLKIVPPQSRHSVVPQITPTADSAKGGNAGRDPAKGGKN